MGGFRCGVLFFTVVLVWSCGDRQAGAGVVVVTDQSVYNQETSGLTTIDFSSFVPAGQTNAAYNTSTGLQSGPVQFVGPVTSGTWEGGGNFLYALTPAYFSSYDAYPNSPTVLSGPPGAGFELLIDHRCAQRDLGRGLLSGRQRALCRHRRRWRDKLGGRQDRCD